ncbi:NADH-ubiquinone oxidoreductase 29.9 kDa subunit [Glarea lozoyensis ATCC 20868]|uniref:NADH-ubiquinone oxidoreductase 29.9 kDa subunit n=1 Tax=Glarea lozoyensis (strain ATCC 20868 / MF5171) TaxID=1116229 RepID=S3DHK1_GLAL2|nr:NADH-ubiquinone oxidoreductase 29.9 kDa subunit [Glarea lozoyensis ATCC 20868]EPE26063.1 NADH-ubiquinone oxidoreductase 29.9 kDa subunit [Glarea lozoyensis ATCC 20868]
MRRTFRQLAAVKPSNYLEPGAPTGLTGLRTHPSPRSALVYLYSRTLDKLAQFPESSLYRQSAEALTKHRMSIVTSIKPSNFEEWKKAAQQVVEAHPDLFKTEDNVEGNIVSVAGKMTKETHGDTTFLTSPAPSDLEDPDQEWDGEKDVKGGIEVGTFMKYNQNRPRAIFPPEPLLTAAQIGELENKIGAGLIEEVIQVAEGELKLADVMLQSRVWEDLAEKPVEGQWAYFKRDTATPTTQQPPQK